MSDPYAGKYLTKGNPYVNALGQSFAIIDPAAQQVYNQSYGQQDAPKVWAQDNNQYFINHGQAVLTSGGVVSLDTIKFALQQSGYTGSTDPASLQQAYELLQAGPPPSPLPPGAPPAPISAIANGLLGPKNLLLYAGGAAVVLLWMGRRH